MSHKEENVNLVSHSEEGASKRLEFATLLADSKKYQSVLELARKIKSIPIQGKSKNIGPQIFLVGGFVRDLFMGRESKDIDVEVYGVGLTELQHFLEQNFLVTQVKQVGKSFGVFKITTHDGLDLDISIPRTESKIGFGHKDFSIASDPYLDPAKAAKRRDFTFNSLMLDPLTGEVLDFYGGLSDLEHKLVRAVDVDTFIEDPLRVWRAIQFASRFGFVIEVKTYQLLKKMVSQNQLDYLPAERIGAEFTKLLSKSDKPSVGLKLIKELGIAEKFYPELSQLEQTLQEINWHPEGNVWTHTMMAVDVASSLLNLKYKNLDNEQKLIVILGVLCHDLGKSTTTQKIDGQIRSLGHESAGVEQVKSLLSKFAYSNEIIKQVQVIVKHHLIPAMLYQQYQRGEIDDKSYANAVRRFIVKIKPVSWRVMLACTESDARGRGLDDALTMPYHAGQKFEELVTQFGLDSDASQQNLISGKDIIELCHKLKFDLQSGPIYRDLIQQIEDARDRQEIETKDQAMQLLEKLLVKLQSL
ncbi:MAG: CCA tRNA nucleotidyltransferase [Candidatus Doudnabacteria bacterium]